MRKAISILGVVGLLAGCVSSEIPKGPDGIFGAVTAHKTNEADLITDIKLMNSNLLYLSAGDYSCGRPEDPELQAILGIKDPAKHAHKRYEGEKVFTAALAAFTAYGAALAKFDTTDAEAAAKQVKLANDTLKNVIGLAGGALPAAATTMLDGVIEPGLKAFVSFVKRREAVAAVRVIQPVLKANADILKVEFTRLSGRERQLFRYWDSCALETLYFVRDLPRDEVEGYFGKNYFGPSSAPELLAMRAAYLEKRSKFTPGGQAEWNALLDAVVTESEAFANGEARVSLGGLVATIDKVKEYKDVIDKLRSAN